MMTPLASEPSSTQTGRVAKTMLGITVSYPVIAAASMYCCYLTARIKLGYWPQPADDDPGNVFQTNVYAIPVFLAIGSIYLGPLLWCAGFGCCWHWGRRTDRRHRIDPLRWSIASAAPIILFWVVVFVLDPWSVWLWLLD